MEINNLCVRIGSGGSMSTQNDEFAVKEARERLARILVHESSSWPVEMYKLFIEELTSEPYISDGNISTALRRAKDKSPEYRAWERRCIASTRIPMNSR